MDCVIIACSCNKHLLNSVCVYIYDLLVLALEKYFGVLSLIELDFMIYIHIGFKYFLTLWRAITHGIRAGFKCSVLGAHCFFLMSTLDIET